MAGDVRSAIKITGEADLPIQGMTGWRIYVKRSFDLIVSLAALILLFPLALVVAVAIKIDSPGPVMFRQTRVGKGGRKFQLYKFRSMFKLAEQTKAAVMHLNEAKGPVFKIKYDPRITRVGRVLRHTSIDELPQLINVLRGEMSLVGPRPPLPEEVEQYDARTMGRLSVTPGLTCLWQVSGRSNVPFDEWIELDLEYIKHQSLLLDFIILLRTIPAVITGRGAQ